jgi:hypothetical protein
VLKVYYLDRLDHCPNTFMLREDLGVFTIPVSMLRVGPEHPIMLTPRAVRPQRSARDTGVSTGVSPMLDLSLNSNNHIIDMIENVFKDRSV